MIDDSCAGQNVGRRRLFWTTQPEACGEYFQCGIECVIPGLIYEDKEGEYAEPGTLPASSGYRTIKNDEWLRGLILNILNTKARTDMKCPSPAAVYGHWSESYREDGLWIGSLLWNAAAKPYVREEDGRKAIEAAVKADMGKLTALELADSVDVKASYKPGNRVEILITAITTQRRHVLNLSGGFISGTWVWH